MPFSTSTVLAGLALLASAVSAKDGRTYAIVRHSGNPIVEARMDPIVDPGQQSMHTHSVFGGTGFAVTMDTDTALNANGTTAVVNGDKSNYWFPKLFFEADNGTFFPVKVTQVNTYYFFEATDDEIKAFPPGLRMLVGDPYKRSAPYTSTSVLDAVDGQDKIQPVQFTCPRSDESTPLYVDNNQGRAVDPANAGAGVGFPDRTCDAIGTGLRYDVHFPSCINPAVDVADFAHNSAYPSSANASGGGKQNCPEGWIHTPHLFLEAYYDQMPFKGLWEEGSGEVPWRLAPGDPTGFALHADFISGWNTDDLQAMIDTCNAGFDGADKCPNLPSGVNTDKEVTIEDPFADEISWGMEKLPGCNPIQNGPGEASQYSGADCTASGTSPEASEVSTSSSAPASQTTLVSAASSAFLASSPTTLKTIAAAVVATSTSTSTSSTSSSSSSSSSSPTLLPTWTSLGCYADLNPSRVLTGINLAYLGPTVSITAYTCSRYCDAQGFTLSGTEYGGQCFCGNDFVSSPQKLADSKCGMACSDGEVGCGGSSALWVAGKGSKQV